MRISPELATDLFISLTEEHTDIDPELLDRAAILAHFTDIFEREQ